MNLKNITGVFKETFSEFSSDKVPRLAAALAYYSLFSLAPLLVISIAIAGFAFGAEAARGEIVGQIRGVVGETAGKAIEEMIENAGKNESRGVFATIAGVVALLFGASGVFGQLKDTLNTIWEVPEKKGGGIRLFLRERLWSFSMVLVIGFLLLTSLILTAAIGAVGNLTSGGSNETLWHILNLLVSLGVITVLFALIFKFVPDAAVSWRDVWIGAGFTSLLFVLGKFGIGLYLGKSSVASTYGAAASLIIVILWVYYSSLILFLGAEFTEVYARRRGGEGARSSRRSDGQSASSRGTVTPQRGAPFSAPLSVSPSERPRKKARRQNKGSGTGKAIVAGVGGIFVGVLLAAVGTVVAIVRGITRLIR